MMRLFEVTTTTATKTMKVGPHQKQDDGRVEHDDHLWRHVLMNRVIAESFGSGDCSTRKDG